MVCTKCVANGAVSLERFIFKAFFHLLNLFWFQFFLRVLTYSNHILFSDFFQKESHGIYLHFLYVPHSESVTAPTLRSPKSLNAVNIFCQNTSRRSTHTFFHHNGLTQNINSFHAFALCTNRLNLKCQSNIFFFSFLHSPAVLWGPAFSGTGIFSRNVKQSDFLPIAHFKKAVALLPDPNATSWHGAKYQTMQENVH